MCMCVDVCIGEEGRTPRQNGSRDHVMVRAQDDDCDHVLSNRSLEVLIQRSYNNGDV